MPGPVILLMFFLAQPHFVAKSDLHLMGVSQDFLIPDRYHGADHDLFGLSQVPRAACVCVEFAAELHLVDLLLVEILASKGMEGHSTVFGGVDSCLLKILFGDPLTTLRFPDKLLAHGEIIALQTL